MINLESQTFTKTCLRCGRPFETKKHWNKEYCDVYCRNRAKRAREKLAGRGQRVEELIAESHVPILNPTIAQLDGMARMMLEKVQLEPKLFKGSVPMWTAPDHVWWTQDLEEQDVWTMCPK